MYWLEQMLCTGKNAVGNVVPQGRIFGLICEILGSRLKGVLVRAHALYYSSVAGNRSLDSTPYAG